MMRRSPSMMFLRDDSIRCRLCSEASSPAAAAAMAFGACGQDEERRKRLDQRWDVDRGMRYHLAG